ncbi:MAG: hypothetical protein J2P30_27480, partial [Actinobacteria bacterium]|nr:hypothetical protein [Actinomycetota bacterium]
MKRKWYLGAGVTCLLAGPLAQFAQYLVTPVDSGAGGAEQVSQAAAHLPAMWIAVLLDVPLLLIIPAVLYLGAVAGGSRSRLAGTGTALAFLSTLAAVFLVAGDVLLYEAGRRPDLAAATALV